MTENTQSSDEGSHHSEEEETEKAEIENADNEEETATFKELVSCIIFFKISVTIESIIKQLYYLSNSYYIGFNID